ncbi:hypothetical protein G7B40_006045 [Aetokthonos hydrillicola Thurmond2011]|uniref:Uncharacterized protein n=1 Tax=Aetokthonos hydrillicola Thurmond2011 TaxID=2712845 RepID=A0AAP5I6M0_9CYAN|nr:hypothetical protein [Aetokthonos hydrillicola Thurmond2011]
MSSEWIKLPLMLLEILANIGSSVANSCLKVQSEPTSQATEVLVSYIW